MHHLKEFDDGPHLVEPDRPELAPGEARATDDQGHTGNLRPGLQRRHLKVLHARHETRP